LKVSELKRIWCQENSSRIS